MSNVVLEGLSGRYASFIAVKVDSSRNSTDLPSNSKSFVMLDVASAVSFNRFRIEAFILDDLVQLL
jgi:hypothetical protein